MGDDGSSTKVLRSWVAMSYISKQRGFLMCLLGCSTQHGDSTNQVKRKWWYRLGLDYQWQEGKLSRTKCQCNWHETRLKMFSAKKIWGRKSSSGLGGRNAKEILMPIQHATTLFKIAASKSVSSGNRTWQWKIHEPPIYIYVYINAVFMATSSINGWFSSMFDLIRG